MPNKDRPQVERHPASEVSYPGNDFHAYPGQLETASAIWNRSLNSEPALTSLAFSFEAIPEQWMGQKGNTRVKQGYQKRPLCTSTNRQ